MKKKLKKIWKNRKQIIEGLINHLFPTWYTKKIVAQRKAICVTCKRYDSTGQDSNCYVTNQPCCTACGCDMNIKWPSLSSECGLSEIGEEPKWRAVKKESNGS